MNTSQNKYIIFIGIILALFAYESAISQKTNSEQGNEQAPAVNRPVEFPSMTVEGKEQLKVQAGVKQYPNKVQSLNSAEIDSISPVHQQQAMLLPVKPLVSSFAKRQYKRNYLNVYAGNFLTLNADAGIGFNINDFNLFVDGHAFYTDGHIKNADAFDGGAKLSLNYIAPRKYWIFGGSRTDAHFKFNTNSYKMYAMDTARGRNAFELSLGVKSEGEYNTYAFSTGASYEMFNIEHNNDIAENSDIAGFLSVGKAIDSSLDVRAKLNLRFGTSFGQSNNFMDFSAGAKYRLNEQTIVNGTAGFQSTGSTGNIQRANIVLIADIDYLLSKFITLEAGVNLNFDDNNFKSAWMVNRFVEHKAKIDFPYEKAVKAAIIIHPSEYLMFSAGAKFSMIDRFRSFVLTDEKIFNLDYTDANGFDVFGKGSLLMSKSGNFSAELHYKPIYYSNSAFNGKNIPNLSGFQMLFVYDNIWMEKFGTKVELNYFGKRYVNSENTESKDGFINLAARISYKLMDNLNLYLKGDNLLNANEFFWGPYKERGLYLSVGAFWQF